MEQERLRSRVTMFSWTKKIGLLELVLQEWFYELSITKMGRRPNTKIDPYYDIGAFVRYDIEDGHYLHYLYQT